MVTCDTSIAHLAGALGRPVWLALKYAPHWTWLTDRSDSPWYPSMRLFRQTERGNWDGVFSEIAAALQARATEPSSSPGLRADARGSGQPAIQAAQPGTLEPLIQEAVQAHHRGELGRAKQLYGQVLRSEPRNTTALANLAVTAISDRNYVVAEKHLREVLSIGSADAGINIVDQQRAGFEHIVLSGIHRVFKRLAVSTLRA